MEDFKRPKTEEEIFLEPKDWEVAKQLGNAAFFLDADNKTVIYQALHFGGKKFEEPRSKKEINPDELMKYLSEKFPETDNIIFSCCEPDKARTFLLT